jgi:hypothetical protein
VWINPTHRRIKVYATKGRETETRKEKKWGWGNKAFIFLVLWRGLSSPWGEKQQGSKQEAAGSYFYLVPSLLSLVSVENESGFHKPPE